METLVARAEILRPENHQPAAAGPNVGPVERMASAAIGAGLLLGAVAGSQRLRVLPALAGAAFLYRGISGKCQVYQALGIDHCQQSDNGTVNDQVLAGRNAMHFDRSLVINSPPEEIFEFWRRLEMLPELIDHLEQVTELDGTRSHWVAKGPFDTKIEWDAEIFENRPDELLAWRSLPDSQLKVAGSLRLTPLSPDRGTAVRLVVAYEPPGGKAAAYLAKWLGANLDADLFEGLRRMKQTLEAGERPTIEGQPQGQCSLFDSGRSPS